MSSIVHCKTCARDIDMQNAEYLAHMDHELVPPDAQAPVDTRPSLRERLAMHRRWMSKLIAARPNDRVGTKELAEVLSDILETLVEIERHQAETDADVLNASLHTTRF